MDKLQRLLVVNMLKKAFKLPKFTKAFIYFEDGKLKIKIDEEKLLVREMSADERQKFTKQFGCEPEFCEVTVTKELITLKIKDPKNERTIKL